MFNLGSGKEKTIKTSEIKTERTVVSNKRDCSVTVSHFSSTSLIQSEHRTEFITREYGSNTLSQPLFQRDANLFHQPTYKSPIERRLGPFASYSANRSSNLSPLLPTRCLNNTTPSNSTQVPTYQVRGQSKGEVLIINIKNFYQNNERKGSEFDKLALQRLFRNILQFNVISFENLSAQEMLKQIDKFKSNKALAKADVSFVIIMSHGDNIKDKKVIPGGYTNIYGSDDKPVLVDDILELFTAQQCPAMASKPKIFIFQCCRGHNFSALTTDGPQHSKIRQYGDMLIAYSTLPGFASFRDPQSGSWFIQGLCKVFSEDYSRLDVESLLKKVQEEHDTKHGQVEQILTYENRGFKTCYLCDIRKI